LPIAKFAYINAYYDSINITPNIAKYGIELDIRQGIEDDPIKEEIPTIKEYTEIIIEKRKELEIT